MERNPFLRKERREKKGNKHRNPSRNQEEQANHEGQRPFLARIEKPIQLKSCLGKKEIKEVEETNTKAKQKDPGQQKSRETKAEERQRSKEAAKQESREAKKSKKANVNFRKKGGGLYLRPVPGNKVHAVCKLHQIKCTGILS